MLDGRLSTNSRANRRSPLRVNRLERNRGMGEKGQIVEVGDAAPPRPIHWRLILLATLTALVAIFYFSGLSDYVSWDELKAHRNSWRALVDAHFVPAVVIFVCVSVT